MRSKYGGALIQFPQINDVVCDLECYRFYVVYKMGLAIALFHGLMALFLTGVRSDEDSRSIIQDAFWPAKLLLLGILFFATMWIPRAWLDLLYYPAVVLAIAFLMAQSLMFVDITYAVTGYCLDHGGSLMGLLMAVSVGLFGLIGYSSYEIYKLFTHETERILMMGSVLLTLILTVCSVLPAVRKGNERSGLFQAAVVGTLSLTIVGSAILFSPQHQMIVATGSDYKLWVVTLIIKLLSAAFAVIAILASAYIGGSNDQNGPAHLYNYSLFHTIFLVASMYMVSSVTNWQMPVAANGSLAFVDNGLAFWAKIGVAAIINGFYAWTLVAPAVLPDRQFDF